MKVFIASTSYDLVDERKFIISKLNKWGYEPVYFETPNFKDRSGKHSHDICINKVAECDRLILIINKRFGGPYMGNEFLEYKDYKSKVSTGGEHCWGHISVTWAEVDFALKNNLPVDIFIRKDTWNARHNNRHNPKYVDKSQIRILDFIDYIQSRPEANWHKEWNDCPHLLAIIKGELGGETAWPFVKLLRHYLTRSRPKVENELTKELKAGNTFIPPNLKIITQIETDSFSIITRGGRQANKEEVKRIKPDQVLADDGKRYVIIADSGLGKTTLLKHIHFIMAGVTRTALKKIDIRGNPSVLPLVPILLHFNELLSADVTSVIRDKLKYYDRKIIDEYGFDEFIEKMLKHNRFFFLIDGLDQIINNGNLEMLLATDGRLGQAKIISAGRPYAWRRFKDYFDGYGCLHIDEFTPKQIKNYLGAAFKKEEVKKVLRKNKELLRIPLLLAMIKTLEKENLLSDVKTQAELYDRFINLLLSRHDNADPEGFKRNLALLSYHTISMGSLGRFSDDQSPKLEKLIGINRSAFKALTRWGIVSDLLEGDQEYIFRHQLFQEYLAAVAINKYADQLGGFKKAVKIIAKNEANHEVIKFLDQMITGRDALAKCLLENGRALLLASYLEENGPVNKYLTGLVKQLVKYEGNWWNKGSDYRKYQKVFAADFIESLNEVELDEVINILALIFQPANRDGRIMYAVVELLEAMIKNAVDSAKLRPANILAKLTKIKQSYLAEAQGYEDSLADEMIMVPAGAFISGGSLERGDPKKIIKLHGYLIGKYPVTNADYERFDPGHKIRRDQYSYQDNQPVVDISWYEAVVYAGWHGKRLPSEAEWAKAARGGFEIPDGSGGLVDNPEPGRIYPWGDVFDKDKCNIKESGIGGTTPVTNYLDGRSPYGCYDMAGNVWEWCEDWFDESDKYKGMRGGSWHDKAGYARVTFRFRRVDPVDRSYVIGFRLAQTL